MRDLFNDRSCHPQCTTFKRVMHRKSLKKTISSLTHLTNLSKQITNWQTVQITKIRSQITRTRLEPWSWNVLCTQTVWKHDENLRLVMKKERTYLPVGWGHNCIFWKMNLSKSLIKVPIGSKKSCEIFFQTSAQRHFWNWTPIENSIFKNFKIITETSLIANSIGNFVLKNVWLKFFWWK